LIGSHRARKRFGQNFLVDAAVVRRIVQAMDPKADDTIVEIGPGLGALTDALVARSASMTAIEIDRDLASRLAARYAPEQLRVHTADALRFDFESLGPRQRVVGNLPYNISSPLLFRLIEYSSLIADVHVMLQSEVVDRLIAAPGSADYGRLTVMLGYYFRAERLFRVGSGAFRPQPKVDSAFARLVPYAPLPWPASDPVLFRKIVAGAFSQRRKTLRNALAGLVDEQAQRRAGIDPGARGETLSIEEFVRLANVVAA
jgi:16S rRNA (adenine1518-N6/adenine1519-N6)-dimethyltransferase